LQFLILSYIILIQLFKHEKINLIRGPLAHPRVLISSQSSLSDAIYFIENNSKLHFLILSYIIYYILLQLFKHENINLVRGSYFSPAGTDQILIWPIRGNLFHWKRFKIAFINIIAHYISHFYTIILARKNQFGPRTLFHTPGY
jgi:hypothetical protein